MKFLTKPYLTGYYVFDADEARQMRENTERRIKKHKNWSMVCAITMYISLMIALVVGVVGAFDIFTKWIINTNFNIQWFGLLNHLLWLIVILTGILLVAFVCYQISTFIDYKPDIEYYSNAELFLITEEQYIINSFIVYNRKYADLYLHYSVVDENNVETTKVYIIEGFEVKRVKNYKVPILDVNNNIYYVPVNYENPITKH